MHNILYLQICSASCKYFCMYGDKIIIIAGVTNFCCLSSKKIHVSLGNMKRRFTPFFTLWRLTDSCVRVAAASPWVFKRNLGYLKIFKIVSFQTATQPDSESDTASILWCKDWHTYPCWDWRTLPCFQSSDHLNPCNNFYMSLHCQTNQGCSRSKVTVTNSFWINTSTDCQASLHHKYVLLPYLDRAVNGLRSQITALRTFMPTKSWDESQRIKTNGWKSPGKGGAKCKADLVPKNQNSA